MLTGMLGFLTTIMLFMAPLVASMNVSNVLIYSETAGYRHESIPTAVRELTRRGSAHGINFVNTEEMENFNDNYLSQFDAVFFLSNTDEVLTAKGKAAFQKYLDRGGNFVGAHAATDCMLKWPTMARTLGSQFQYHPDFTNATMVVLDPSHPGTAGLPRRWNVTDEIYNFTTDPRDLGVIVVLAVDESSYRDPGRQSSAQGDPHPIAWYQERLKGTNATGLVGRSWYTGLGHAAAAWQNDVFMGHILGGVTFVLASNTTRAMNPHATVGSLGPEYTPEPAPLWSLPVVGANHRQPNGLKAISLESCCLLSPSCGFSAYSRIRTGWNSLDFLVVSSVNLRPC